MLFVCFLAFLLALAAFFVGWVQGKNVFFLVDLNQILLLFLSNQSYVPFPEKAFVGASVGYFSFLFLLAGRALTVSFI